MVRKSVTVVIFDDKSRYLDRFCLLLGATVTAIVMLSLTDLSGPANQVDTRVRSHGPLDRGRVQPVRNPLLGIFAGTDNDHAGPTRCTRGAAGW